MEQVRAWLAEKWPIWLGIAAIAAVCVTFSAQVGMLVRIVGGGGLMTLVLEPLAGRLARRIPRAAAAAVSVVGAAVILAGIVAVAMPIMWRQMTDLFSKIEEMQTGMQAMAERINVFLESRSLPQLAWEGIDWSYAAQKAGAWLGETASYAGVMVRRIGELGMMALVAFYMLRDMEALKLRLEWLLPRKFRSMGLRIAAEIRTELGAYLRGQVMISLAVGGLAAVGMWIVDAPGAAVLGGLVGIFNLIPYFGPVIGGAPAVLLALGKGIWCAVRVLIVLVAVQQIDGYLISPRFMGQSTGLHPAFVLLGIAMGGGIAGALGMLLAVPFMLSIRAIARIWRLRHERV